MAAVALPPPMPTAGCGQRYAVSMVDQHQPGGPKYFDRSRPPQVSVHCCKHIVCMGRFDSLWIVCVCVCVCVWVFGMCMLNLHTVGCSHYLRRWKLDSTECKESASSLPPAD